MANYKTSWVQRLIEGAWQKTFAFAHAKTVYTDYANKKTLADKLSEIDTEIGNKANKTEIPTELPANGGNSATVNGHTVNADVPENAVFTDTVYDDTEVQKTISELTKEVSELNSNLSNIDKLLNVGKNEGIGIDSSTGDLVKSGQYTTSDLILVSPNTKYKYDVALSSGDYSRIAFYKNDGTFINRQDRIYDFVTPSDCYYLRIMVMTVDYNSGHLYGSDVNNEVNKLNGDVADLRSDVDYVNPIKSTNVAWIDSTVSIFSGETNGITYEYMGDGAIKISGTVEPNSIDQKIAYFIGEIPDSVGRGKVKLLGLPFNTSNESFNIGLKISGPGGAGTVAKTSSKDGVIIDLSKIPSSASISGIYLSIPNGTVIPNDFIIRPFLTTNLNATLSDFVPYTGSKGQLNDDLSQVAYSIGNPSKLLTNQKILVNAINELNNRLTALENK